MSKDNYQVDILAFSPHPDDVEFGCGGFLAKATKQGMSAAIIDMSLSELSSNGDVKSRLQEATEAAKILGVKKRENLKLPNNFFVNSTEVQNLLVDTIRKYKPKMVLLPYYFDRHPDHENGAKLIREALFNAGLKMFQGNEQLEKHRPVYVFCYMMWYEFQPSIIVDITDTFDQKKQSILAYKSQTNLAAGGVQTIDNKEDTLKYIEARARHYGFPIQKTYGEPYLSFNTIGVNNPFDLLPNFY